MLEEVIGNGRNCVGEMEEIAWGAEYWQAASLTKAGERENQVSEEAILANRLTRLKGWIRA
jgi:hypothetical protein